MADFIKKLKVRVIQAVIVIAILTAFWSYFIPDTVMTQITDARMIKVNGTFMIATEDRPFVNEDTSYRLKFDSGNFQNDAIRLRGKVVKIRKYGWRIKFFSMYENVVTTQEVRESARPTRIPPQRVAYVERWSLPQTHLRT